MAVSSLPYIQSIRVPFKACSLFSAGVCGGFNKKKRIHGCVFDSLRKLVKDIHLQSKVSTFAIMMEALLHFWKIKDRDALYTIISSRKVTFSSRSRATLWTKGETSDNFINIHDIFVDCDRDSIIYLGSLMVLPATQGRRLAFSHQEEADELCQTLEEKEESSRTASEMADVIYHAMVLLRRKDRKCSSNSSPKISQSGIEEKQNRAIKQS